MFKEKTVVENPKSLCCFSGVDRTRRGMVGLIYILFYWFREIRLRRCASRGALQMCRFS